MNEEGHPLVVRLDQILPLFAKEIYSSPLAFLRENVQNAFDAVRLQLYREKINNMPPEQHRVDVVIGGTEVNITDTGIGMSAEDMKQFYWSLGQTGKNTEEAREAGVVGTFGIGGMANFGVAYQLQLISRTANNTPAVISSAVRDQLSITDKCVFYSRDESSGVRGTTVVARLHEPPSLETARQYLQAIVRFVEIPIYFNGDLISGMQPPWTNPDRYHEDRPAKTSYSGTSGNLSLKCDISADRNGRPTVTFTSVTISRQSVMCAGILQSSREAVSTYRYGFKLADIGVSTIFGLGGHIDCSVLRPTAGRDTLDTESKSIVQRCVEIAERGIVELLSSAPSLVDSNVSLFQYVHVHGIYDTLGHATVRTYGSQGRTPLGDIRTLSKSSKVLYTLGQDTATMEVLSKQGRLIVVLSSDAHRRRCEEQYLSRYCSGKVMESGIIAAREIPESEVSIEQFGFLSGVDAILRVRYLLDGVRVRAVELTQNAVVWVPQSKGTSSIIVWIDTRHAHVKRLIQLRGTRNYGTIIDLFVRDYVFPLIKEAIPSVTSEGFDVLLQRLQSRMEIMRIDLDDVRLMQDYAAEPTSDVTRRPSAGTYAVVSDISIKRTDVANVNELEKRASEQGIVEESKTELPQTDIPPKVQTMKHTMAQLSIPEKILDFTPKEHDLAPWISGFYLALTLDAYSFYKQVIERRPRLAFNWGGYRGSYLFFEREATVLYYDIEFTTLLQQKGSEASETGAIECTREPLFSNNNIFLPIPDDFVDSFVPKTEPIRLIIRHEMLTPETQATLTEM